MKTIGEKAKEFREARGWNSMRMAKEVGTSRQNIENLELKGNRKPHYIIDLARVMGTTVDALLQGDPTQSGVIPPDYKPNQALSGESIGSGAVNINSDRRTRATAQAVVASLSELLAGVEPGRMGSVIAALADLARSPNDEVLRDSLTRLMAPAAFTQKNQNRM